eukprot:8355636-Ditylum_brightwellii.AAC.1
MIKKKKVNFDNHLPVYNYSLPHKYPLHSPLPSLHPKTTHDDDGDAHHAMTKPYPKTIPIDSHVTNEQT